MSVLSCCRIWRQISHSTALPNKKGNNKIKDSQQWLQDIFDHLTILDYTIDWYASPTFSKRRVHEPHFSSACSVEFLLPFCTSTFTSSSPQTNTIIHVLPKIFPKKLMLVQLLNGTQQQCWLGNVREEL